MKTEIKTKTEEYPKLHGNRKYKDTLFRKVFQKKEDLLELYNAINQTSYENVDDMEITTLENVLYIKMKNDVSFIIGCTMNLYEHQSSYTPNMPLRGLMYFMKLYNSYIGKRGLNLYSSALQKIPTPRYVVFYNGLKDEPDRQIQRLSDAFETEGGCLECEALMLNINRGHNLELMKRCRRLEEYTIFVDTVKKYYNLEHLSKEEAIEAAIDECIEAEILKDILIEERAEIVTYVLETFDEELYERDLKNIAYEEGEKAGYDTGRSVGEKAGYDKGRSAGEKAGYDKGITEKLKEQVRKKLAKGKSVSEIADALEETEQTIQKIVQELS